MFSAYKPTAIFHSSTEAHATALLEVKMIFSFQEMYALISWNKKNGIALGKEKLEVLPSTKFVVMNGGRLQAGAEVTMVYRKEMWGGNIHSVYGNLCPYKSIYMLFKALSLLNHLAGL